MSTLTPLTRSTGSTTVSAGEALEEVLLVLTGAGIAFMTFLGAIPGLLPVVALVAAAGIVLVVPAVAAAVVIAAVVGPPLLAVRIARRLRG